MVLPSMWKTVISGSDPCDLDSPKACQKNWSSSSDRCRLKILRPASSCSTTSTQGTHCMPTNGGRWRRMIFVSDTLLLASQQVSLLPLSIYDGCYEAQQTPRSSVKYWLIYILLHSTWWAHCLPPSEQGPGCHARHAGRSGTNALGRGTLAYLHHCERGSACPVHLLPNDQPWVLIIM